MFVNIDQSERKEEPLFSIDETRNKARRKKAHRSDNLFSQTQNIKSMNSSTNTIIPLVSNAAKEGNKHDMLTVASI